MNNEENILEKRGQNIGLISKQSIWKDLVSPVYVKEPTNMPEVVLNGSKTKEKKDLQAMPSSKSLERMPML